MATRRGTTPSETGVAARRGIGAALAILVLPTLVAAQGSPPPSSEVDLTWVLDAVGESPCGSRLRLVQATNAACYDTYDDFFSPGTGTEFELTIDAPSLGEISHGDVVTLHDFFLPPPAGGGYYHLLDIDFAVTMISVGLANLGTEQDPIPDTSFVIDELVGVLVETSPGLFALSFPTFPVYWSGLRPATGASDSGIIPLSLSTQQTFINAGSTTPAVPGVSPEVPGTCTGGTPGVPGVGYPIFALPGQASDFQVFSRLAMGGATCPSGLGSVTGLTERAFSLELQGALVLPNAPPCSDGIDNDGDGLTDFVGGDPGCDDGDDASERSAALPCDNGIDDDGDGWTDYVPDFDQDGIGDFPGDPACKWPGYAGESRNCQNGIDDDGDGRIDYDGGASLDHDGDGFVDPQFNPAEPGVTGPDAACTAPWLVYEVPPACGLGFELVLLVPLLARLGRRASA